MNAKEAALKVFSKLENMSVKGGLIAVFVKHGTDVQMTKPTSELFEKAIAVRLKDFAGVYNYDAKISWIEDDLIYCGMEK